MSTSTRMLGDFLRLLFLQAHRETAASDVTSPLLECQRNNTATRIIQELAKVLSGNEATSLLHIVQGSSYARHYQRRMGDARPSRARGDAGNDGGVAWVT